MIGRGRAAWWLWCAGTALVVASWFDLVSPSIGWCGFGIGLLGSVVGWGLRPPSADSPPPGGPRTGAPDDPPGTRR